MEKNILIKKIFSSINNEVDKMINIIMNKSTSVFDQFILNGIAVTTFCYSFTYTYFDFFGVNYLGTSDYSDVYRFTLGNLSVFFLILSLALFLFLILVVMCLVKYRKNRRDKNISTLLSLSVFIIFIASFILSYSGSFYDVLLFLIAIFFFGFMLIVLLNQNNYYFLLFLFSICTSFLLGGKLGNVFAKDAIKFGNNYDILLNKKSILNEHQMYIGENSEALFIYDKQNKETDLIRKSDNITIKIKKQNSNN
ncbi:hypothetical protein ACFFUE_09665 [Bergeyella porcorum]|uniref:hypothetical protein n=1 Tax=Bergeyella porcorum TaxID=1735111 RepID=UPI0035EB3727